MNDRAGDKGRQIFKRLCQCIGLASLILVVNYGELLGGGADARMHVPYPLTGICLAQIADILSLGLGLFAVMAFARKLPMPGRPKMTSITAAPVSMLPNCRPMMVITGMRVLRSAWS